jgi:hypothetical protein
MSSHDDGGPFDAKLKQRKEQNYFKPDFLKYIMVTKALSFKVEHKAMQDTVYELGCYQINPETQKTLLAKKSSISWSRNSQANFSSTVYFSRTFLKEIIRISSYWI